MITNNDDKQQLVDILKDIIHLLLSDKHKMLMEAEELLQIKHQLHSQEIQQSVIDVQNLLVK